MQVLRHLGFVLQSPSKTSPMNDPVRFRLMWSEGDRQVRHSFSSGSRNAIYYADYERSTLSHHGCFLLTEIIFAHLHCASWQMHVWVEFTKRLTLPHELSSTRTVSATFTGNSIFIFPRCLECQRGLATRKLSVCLSVCLSVKRVDCDKTEEKSVQIFIPYERSFSLVFREEEWLAKATLLPEILGQANPVGAKLPIFRLYSVQTLGNRLHAFHEP